MDGDNPEVAPRVYNKVVVVVRPQRSPGGGTAAAAPSRLTDAELLQLVARGDTVAFRALWQRNGGAVYALCRRVLGDAGHAEDAAQETFVRVWRGAEHAPA